MKLPSRRRVGHLVTIVGAALVVVFVLYCGYRVVDDRNNRRTANASALAHTEARAEANAARIAAIADTTRQICATQNIDAHRLNKVLDYIEVYVKANSTDPGIDAFFAGIPRPVVTKCTAAPGGARPPQGAQAP